MVDWTPRGLYFPLPWWRSVHQKGEQRTVRGRGEEKNQPTRQLDMDLAIHVGEPRPPS